MSRRIAHALVVLSVVLFVNQPVYAQSSDPPSETVVHIVQRGETMGAIARRYGVTMDAVAHANGLPDPRHIYVGQRLTIPGGNVAIDELETQPYLVRTGDTLTAIARRYHTTWQTLAWLNRMLSPDALYTGQIIQVPKPATLRGQRLPDEGATHIVRSDETLFRIALRHDVSPWVLASESQVANPSLIYPGQALVVPGKGSSLLPEPFVSVEIQPLPAAQGSTLVIAVRMTELVTLEGELFERQVRFAEENGVYYGIVGVHVFEEPGLYELLLRAVDSEGEVVEVTADVKVVEERFGYSRIDVAEGRANLLDPALIAADRKRLDAVRQTFTKVRYWDEFFERPCVGHISSYFGTHRSYNGSPYTSYHSGVDFKAPGGTPVYAPAPGNVVMAEKLNLWGNAIAIDHGWGVLTGYGHLSAIEVEVGQRVDTGDLIGRVGNSGLSTGSHLHWETWAGGVSVDGLQWLEGFYPWPEPSVAGTPAGVGN